MKEITVLSGKGGTGKTSITAAIASVSQSTVFCDNDVDAADLHLIFHPQIREDNLFFSGWKVSVNEEKCTGCQDCMDHCRFDAIQMKRNGLLNINPFKCEGCRLCERICPVGAIISERNRNNHWYVSSTRFGILVHARMEPGEENSGKLVTQVRKRAREIAMDNKSAFILNDGPPGIGCAAIASLSGTDAVLAVIEPSKSGFHDLNRLIELIQSFKIRAYAVINKYNLNLKITAEMEEYLRRVDVQVLAKIPFDKEVVESMSEGKTIVEYDPGSEISEKITQVWQMMKN